MKTMEFTKYDKTIEFDQYYIEDALFTKIGKEKEVTDWVEVFKSKRYFHHKNRKNRSKRMAKTLFWLFLDFIFTDIIVNNNKFKLPGCPKVWEMEKWDWKFNRFYYKIVANGPLGKYKSIMYKKYRFGARLLMVMHGRYNALTKKMIDNGQKYL